MREETHDLSIFEKKKEGGVHPRLAVKKYARSAADRKMDEPGTLRGPEVLLQTVEYLVGAVLDTDTEKRPEFKPGSGPDGRHTLEEILPFILDRLRAVQQDFSILGEKSVGQDDSGDAEFVRCHEISAQVQLLFANEALAVSN